jgi:hypothetical protein
MAYSAIVAKNVVAITETPQELLMQECAKKKAKI